MKITKSSFSTTTWYSWDSEELMWEKIFSIGDEITRQIKSEGGKTPNVY